MSGTLKKKIMWVDVRIPYNENGNLAGAYNRILLDSSASWILFLDHDVFLVNPLWYEICLQVIEILANDPLTACIGCIAGGERTKRILKENGTPNADIEYHIREAKKRYNQFGIYPERIYKHVTGYFLLVNREIACKVGKFEKVNGTINNIDKHFGEKILEAGYHNYKIPGLYVYHRRGMKHLKQEFEQPKQT